MYCSNIGSANLRLGPARESFGGSAGSAGAGPDHAFDAAARAAAEDDRPTRPGYRAVIDRNECTRRQTAGREVDPHERCDQLDRLRGPLGADSRAPLTSDLMAKWSPSNNSADSFNKDPPNATVSADGSKVRDAVVVLKTAKLERDRLLRRVCARR